MSLVEWEETERSLHHCFAEYGVAHVTISPELHHAASQTSTQTMEGGTGDELLGKCKVFSKDGSGCIFDDKPVIRKRSTQHSHA